MNDFYCNHRKNVVYYHRINLFFKGNQGMVQKEIKADKIETILSLFGNYDENVNLIQREYSVVILGRGDNLTISGEEKNVFEASEAVKALISLIEKGETLNETTIRYVFSLVREGRQYEVSHMSEGGICVTVSGKVVKPKTLGQKKYVQAIKDKTIVLGVGPAGTGKTYLAVAMAVKAFKAHEVEKIILTRPAVEAGEKLGFLPGDLQNKVDPYLRPLYDALFEMLGPDTFNKQQERGCIEVAPLAYMRGRTLDDSFIILDEAQNTTHEQMKMFLTRLGFNSKIVITGDITQIDLPDDRRSGLIQAMNILKDIDDISICRFNQNDVVRHKLVQDIIMAYEKYSKRNVKSNGQG